MFDIQKQFGDTNRQLTSGRCYSAFLATRVAVLDDTRVTPAHTKFDAHNY